MITYNHKNIPMFSVSELNLTCRILLETSFPSIWVTGEISNFICHHSGHWYFSLKDDQTQIRCAMFCMHNKLLEVLPENGMQVKVQAKVSIYPNRGDFQLIVEKLELIGEGLLKKTFEELVIKLAKSGLFQQQYKKAIPTLPKHIGIITSPTGAAIQDILIVLKRRFPSIPVSIYPALVQGEQAPKQIQQALELAQKNAIADVLILARGGGSLEDLFCFNDPQLAQAIFDCTIPIVSGIGHEIDTTISDLVSDLRAPTPSAAAELITPDGEYYREKLSSLYDKLNDAIFQSFQIRSQQVDTLQSRLKHPRDRVLQLMEKRLFLTQELVANMKQTLTQSQYRFEMLIKTLNTLSPLATLTRGYAIASTNTGKILYNTKIIAIKDKLHIQLSKGKFECSVLEIF